MTEIPYFSPEKEERWNNALREVQEEDLSTQGPFDQSPNDRSSNQE